MGNLGNIQSLNPHGRIGGLTNLQYPFVKKDQTVYNTIYVNTATGNDANTGYKPSAPKATIQNANDSWRIGILYILIAGGTYAEWPVIDKNVEFKGSYNATFTTQNFVSTPTTCAKVGSGVDNYALTFTSATDNGCIWGYIETISCGTSGYPHYNTLVNGSPIIINGTSNALSTNSPPANVYMFTVDNSGASDSCIIDGIYITDGSTSIDHSFCGISASANAKVIARNNLIESYYSTNSNGQYRYGAYSIGGGSFVAENNTIILTGRCGVVGLNCLGSGVSLKNNIMHLQGTVVGATGIFTDETIVAENNDIYIPSFGAADKYFDGSTAPANAYITSNPALNTGADVGRFTSFVSGDWAPRAFVGSCRHTVNGVEYIYMTGADPYIWRYDGTDWIIIGCLPGTTNGGEMVSYKGKLYTINTVGHMYVSSDDGVTWTRLSDLWFSNRTLFRLFVLNNKLYLTAGMTGDWATEFATTYCYDETLDSWAEVLVGAAVVYGHTIGKGVGVITVGGTEKVFIFGGTNNSYAYTKEVYSWDGVADRWTKETDASWTATAFSMTDVYNNKIYMAHGYQAAPISDFWDFDGTTWAQIFPDANATARYSGCLRFKGTDAYLFSGVMPPYLSDTWKYTFGGNTWTEVYTNTGQPMTGTPPMVSQGGTDLSAEFTMDKDGNDRTIPWSMGCYKKP